MANEALVRKLCQRLSLRPGPTLLKEMALFLRIPESEVRDTCKSLENDGLVTFSGDTVTAVPWWDLDRIELFLNVPLLPQDTFARYTRGIDSLSRRLRNLGFPVIRPNTNETLLDVLLDPGAIFVLAGVASAIAAFAGYVVKSRLSPRIELKAIRRTADGSEVLLDISANTAEEVLAAFESLTATLRGCHGISAEAPPNLNQLGPTVFISYRRADTEGIAGRIYDHLRFRFGPDHVFMDVESILPGVDFREVLRTAVARCNVLLAIIGKSWLKCEADGKCRLDDPNDYVRVEVETALRRAITVIPVLIGSASMPKEGELPLPLAALAHRHSFQIDPGANFRSHVSDLSERLRACLQQR